MVPAASVDQVRVDLASANIPSSGTVGLPPPISFSLGETNSEIQINQLIDLEATLESTIDSIAGVKGSKVMINQPAPSLFGQGAAAPSASVFVDLNPGASLAPGQVRGIMNRVAHAVSGLSLNQVSVVDQYGTVLSQGALSTNSASSLAGQASQQLAAEQAVDSQISSQVSSLLDQVLGPGNAVVRVNAVLNFNNRELKQVVYGKTVLASQTSKVSTSKQSALPVKAAGAAGNTAVYPTVGTGPSSSSSKNISNNYDVNQTVSQETIPAGGIQHLSVAVAVDQKMTPAKLNAIRNLVIQAAGVNLRAGDQVDVLAQPFNHSQLSQALAAIQATTRANRLRQQVEAAAAFLLFLLVVFGIRKVIKNQAHRQLELAESKPLYLASGGPPIAVQDYLPESRPQIASASERSRQHLVKTAQEDPEKVARLIRTWMAEDE
jgi:flagellar M-ring protein FliF